MLDGPAGVIAVGNCSNKYAIIVEGESSPGLSQSEEIR